MIYNEGYETNYYGFTTPENDGFCGALIKRAKVLDHLDLCDPSSSNIFGGGGFSNRANVR